MKYKIIKNRKLVQDEKFAGYNKENRAEKLEFEIPENLQDYAEKICFETDDGNFFDLLEDNTYIIKNNLTKFDKIRFYLEFTKELEQDKIELIKTEVKTLEFKDSFDVDKEIDEEEIEVLDRLILQINEATDRANAISEDLENKVATDYYRGATGEQGPQGNTGENGADAKINGVNTLTIEAGDNITLDQEGNILTINSTGGGSGGTSNYNALTNKPKINNVELNGNKTLNDLGIQPAGNYALESEMPTKTSDLTNDSGFITGYTETDPTVPSYVKNITQANITSWNNKSDFSGNYNDLTNKPTIPVVPTNVSAFTNDVGYLTQHQDISGKANKISVVQTSASTIEINSNTFYKFGEVASLNSTATTLTLPSSIKWLETPTIDANKIYQCSIVDNIGLLVGVTNV